MQFSDIFYTKCNVYVDYANRFSDSLEKVVSQVETFLRSLMVN